MTVKQWAAFLKHREEMIKNIQESDEYRGLEEQKTRLLNEVSAKAEKEKPWWRRDTTKEIYDVIHLNEQINLLVFRIDLLLSSVPDKTIEAAHTWLAEEVIPN